MRLAFTLLAIALAVGARLASQPGIDPRLLMDPALAARVHGLTFAGLGLTPYFAAFGVFGLLYVLWSRSEDAPSRLRRVAPVVAAVLALLREARSSSSASPGRSPSSRSRPS